MEKREVKDSDLVPFNIQVSTNDMSAIKGNLKANFDKL